MIDCKQLCCSRRCWILTAAAVVYFTMFPADLEALLLPLQTVFDLSNAVSPWLYGLAAVGFLCCTARTIWSGRDQTAKSE